jgi:hypothetical protein
MGTDAYLEIVLPGMTDWDVRESRGSDGAVLGYELFREQTAALHRPGAGNEGKLPEIKAEMEARARRLNQAAEPLRLPRVS